MEITNKPSANEPNEADDNAAGAGQPIGRSHPNAPNHATPATQRDIFRWDFPVPDGTVVLNGHWDILGGYQPLDVVLTGTRSATAQRRLRLLLENPGRRDVVSVGVSKDATGHPSLAVDTLEGVRLGIAPVDLVGHLLPVVEEWAARGWRVLTWASIGLARRPFGEIASELAALLAQGKAIPPDFGDPALSYIDVTLRVPGPDQQVYADAASASSAFPLEAWYGRFSRAEQVRRSTALKIDQRHEIIEETRAAVERVSTSRASLESAAGFLDIEPLGLTKVEVGDADRTNLDQLFPEGARRDWVVFASLHLNRRPDATVLEVRVADMPVGSLPPDAAHSWVPFVDQAVGIGLTPRIQVKIARQTVSRHQPMPFFRLHAQILADEDRHRLFSEQPERDAARLEKERVSAQHAVIVEADRVRRLARETEMQRKAANRAQLAASRTVKEARAEKERIWRVAGLCVGCGGPITGSSGGAGPRVVVRGRPPIRCPTCRTAT